MGHLMCFLWVWPIRAGYDREARGSSTGKSLQDFTVFSSCCFLTFNDLTDVGNFNLSETIAFMVDTPCTIVLSLSSNNSQVPK